MVSKQQDESCPRFVEVDGIRFLGTIVPEKFHETSSGRGDHAEYYIISYFSGVWRQRPEASSGCENADLENSAVSK